MNLRHNIDKNLENIKSHIPEGVSLIAVSKFHPIESIREAYTAGHRMFGESRVQELVYKHENLDDLSDIEWHFIGPLQRNKVKYIVPFISLIHSVDSLRLLDEIEKQGSKIDRIIPILLEVKVAQEDSKSGLSEKEVVDIVERIKLYSDKYNHVEVRGLMAMATNTDDISLIKQEFENVHSLFETIKASGVVDKDKFVELSMGMSGDYEEAIECGATLVRIGSAIFGDRDYK